MTESNGINSFAAKLLQQEEAFLSTQYQEHRMKLELQLSRAEWKERVTSRVIIFALAISIMAMFVIGSGRFGSADPGNQDATFVSVSMGVLYGLSATVFWMGLASYYSRFRPGVRRIRELLLEESIRELRQDVNELRKLMSASQPGDRSSPA